MLSIRSLVRSLPRAVARASATTARNHRLIHRQPVLLQSSWTQMSKPWLSTAFSSTARTTAAAAKEGQVDEELAAKLESELQLEQEMQDPDEVPLSISDFLNNSPFTVHDTPGREEVVLTRPYGDENIRVVFSITDLNNVEQDPDKYDDRALYDEDEEGLDGMDGQSGGAQSKGAITSGQTKNGNINVAPENRVAPADRQELADDESAAAEDGSGEDAEPSFPARVNITVSKPGKGSLQIETVAQDGSIIIESVYYYSDPSLAEPKTPEHELARRDLYLGPPFGNLDEDLQVILERYLDERGINTALALFIPDYVDYKEQKEYLRWLSNVKSFVE